MTLSTESVPDISNQRKDMIILETLSQPGEITSAAVGHFLNRKQFTLVLAKQTILSIFNYDAESGTFNLLDHKPTFKQIFSIHTVPQQHILDCILIITVNGEGIVVQWHENDFFPLVAGQYLDAALSIMENPLRRRYRVDPTFLQYIQTIPIHSSSSQQLSKPSQISRSKPVNENEITDTDLQPSDIIDADPLLSQRVLTRSLCFIDESVLVGLSYDGAGSDLMYAISQNMDETLDNIPQMFGWGDGYEAVIENGLEHIWRAKQKQKVNNRTKTIQENEKEKENKKEKVVIAQASMFIFSEEGNCETFQDKNIILDNILRIRHVECMNSMILSDFPFNQSDDRDHSNDEIVNIYAIVDTAEGVSLLSFNLDYIKQTMKLGPFVIIGIPNSSSRIIVLSNEQNQDQNQLADDIAHQVLKGAEQVEVEQIANIKDYDLLTALKGKSINDDDDKQLQQSLIQAKQLQKLIRHKRSKAEMLSIQIKQIEEVQTNKDEILPGEILSPLIKSSFDTHSESTQQTNKSIKNNKNNNHSFIPYILASSKAIILQQSINKAFIFPFSNALPIPPFGFCHVYVEDRTEQVQDQNSDQQKEQHQSPQIFQQEDQNQSQQFIHKLLLGGGKDILTIQDGQIHAQHYENKCINDIEVIQPKRNKPKRDKQKTKILNSFQHTTAVITSTSGFPILMQIETGIIKEVDDDDDFCLPTGNIQQVINILPKWQNQHQIQEDRMAFGVAHGISGTGEIQLVSVGHKLKEIIQDDWSCNENTKLFSSQYYAG